MCEHDGKESELGRCVHRSLNEDNHGHRRGYEIGYGSTSNPSYFQSQIQY
jgi:hypothetical protein